MALAAASVGPKFPRRSKEEEVERVVVVGELVLDYLNDEPLAI